MDHYEHKRLFEVFNEGTGKKWTKYSWDDKETGRRMALRHPGASVEILPCGALRFSIPLTSDEGEYEHVGILAPGDWGNLSFFEFK